MKLKKIAASLFVAAFAVTSVLAMNPFSASAAGNYEDSRRALRYNGDGCSIDTPSRPKLDYTSSYINDDASDDYPLSVDVVGTYDANPICYIIPDWNRCTYGDRQTVSLGESSYLPNLVKERGFSYANFSIDVQSYDPCWVSFLWSPDSI
ncbi:conserved exported protein of unknown function [Ruminococcaceae bacterium BL-4]|nr:conserved exported protein of unknown function [Ruminococcaceae bacterium BL-4]